MRIHYTYKGQRHTHTLDPSRYDCSVSDALDLVLTNLPGDAEAFAFELTGPELAAIRTGR